MMGTVKRSRAVVTVMITLLLISATSLYGQEQKASERLKNTKWRGREPTEEKFKELLARHQVWYKVHAPEGELTSGSARNDPRRADLSGANLSGARLRAGRSMPVLLVAKPNEVTLWAVANQSGIELCGANLSGADLRDANLSGAALWKANLSGAELWFANLSGADLRDANLSGAKLRAADLSGTIFEPREPKFDSHRHFWASSIR